MKATRSSINGPFLDEPFGRYTVLTWTSTFTDTEGVQFGTLRLTEPGLTREERAASGDDGHVGRRLAWLADHSVLPLIKLAIIWPTRGALTPTAAPIWA